MLVMAFMMMSFVILSVEVLDMDEQMGKYLGGLADYLSREFFRVLTLILGAFFAYLLSSFIAMTAFVVMLALDAILLT